MSNETMNDSQKNLSLDMKASQESPEYVELDEKDRIRYRLLEDQKSTYKKYSELVVGELSLGKLLRYELITMLLGPVPGALGLLLRKIFYPLLFKKVGKGVIFGRDVTIRHGDKIELGNNVVIDDYSLMDGRGAGAEGIVIGDNVIINRGVTIQAKKGGIRIGSHSNIGAGSSVVAMGGVYIDEMVGMAGHCSISGGGFSVEREKDSVREHSMYSKGPIRIDKKCRLGIGAVVLDGVHIKEGCLVGAGSLVVDDLPEYCVAAGVPAKARRDR